MAIFASLDTASECGSFVFRSVFYLARRSGASTMSDMPALPHVQGLPRSEFRKAAPVRLTLGIGRLRGAATRAGHLRTILLANTR